MKKSLATNNTMKLMGQLNTIRSLLEVGGKVECKLKACSRGRTIVKLTSNVSIEEVLNLIANYKGDYKLYNKTNKLLGCYTN